MIRKRGCWGRVGTSTTWPSTMCQGGRSHADIHQMVVARVAQAAGTSSGEVPTSPAGGTEMETGAQTDCVREKTTTLVWSPHQSLFLISSRCTVSTTFPLNRSDIQCQLSAVNRHCFVSAWLMNLSSHRAARPIGKYNWKAHGLFGAVSEFLCVGVF